MTHRDRANYLIGRVLLATIKKDKDGSDLIAIAEAHFKAVADEARKACEEALQFYADESIYNHDPSLQFSLKAVTVECDRGQVARAALENLK